MFVENWPLDYLSSDTRMAVWWPVATEWSAIPELENRRVYYSVTHLYCFLYALNLSTNPFNFNLILFINNHMLKILNVIIYFSSNK